MIIFAQLGVYAYFAAAFVPVLFGTFFRDTPRIAVVSAAITAIVVHFGLYYTLFTIPVILPFYFWDKARQERLIAKSDLEWVIVRPGALNNADKRGQVSPGRHVGNFLWTVRISRADVADFMLNQVESDTYLRTAPGIAWESR